MAINVYYAVKITTRTTVNDLSRGITDGVFRLITGRPGFNGDPILTGDVVEQIWYENLIKNIGSISTKCNPLDGGKYGTQSGFSLGLDNEDDLHEFLEDNEIYLSRCKVEVYFVINQSFTQCWTGVIDKFSYDDHQCYLECIDSFKDMHKNVPPDTFDDVRHPGVLKSIIGKPIPISIGYVTKARLFPIEEQDKVLTVFSNTAGESYKATACTAYAGGPTRVWNTSATITIKTGRTNFTTNQLQNKFLTIIHGAQKESVRIMSNAASTNAAANDSDTTTLTLERNFSDTTKIQTWSLGTYNYLTGTVPTFFEISSYLSNGILSNKQIASIEERTPHVTQLDTYDDSTERYEPIDQVLSKSSLTNLDNTGYPGIQIASNTLESDGVYRSIFFLTPTRVDRTATSTSGTGVFTNGNFPALNTDMPNVRDVDRTTGYNCNFTTSAISDQLTMTFKIKSRQFLESFADLSDLFLSIDLAATNVLSGVTSVPVGVLLTSLVVKDFFGSSYNLMGTSWVELGTMGAAGSSAPPEEWNSIPNRYYDGVPSEMENTYNLARYLSIRKKILDTKVLQAFGDIEITLKFDIDSVSGGSVQLYFNEITLIGERKVMVRGKTNYAKIKGEIRGIDGDTWGPGTSTLPVTNGIDAIQYLMRQYDIGYDTLDYSSLVAQYMDVSTFTAALAQRSGWDVGMQIVDRKNNIDHIEGLLKTMVACIVPDRFGRRMIKCWLSNTTPVTTFNSSSGIDRNSIVKIQDVDLRKVFNDFSIKYAYNPATGEYDKHIFITKTNLDSFPAESDVDSDGNLLWKQYVGGVEDYDTAEEWWSLCHEAWLKTNTIQPYVLELPWVFEHKAWNPSDSEDNSTAHKLVAQIIDWFTSLRRIVKFTQAIIYDPSVTVLDPANFIDPVLTSGATKLGWVTEVAINPKTDKIETEFIYKV